MKNWLLLPLFSLLLACGGADEVQTAGSGTADHTVAPAPGVQPPPPPPAAGGESYTLLELSDFREVEGCTVLLWPEDGESGRYVYGFNYAEGPAEGRFGGRLQSLEVESEEAGTEGRPNTYVHANDDYEVTTTFTRENQVDSELWEISGTVIVREKRSGKTVRISVLGEQGC
ncbi:hypothetical protein [Lewinella sp. IMCC34183]|uniref:hypothetical protein n=1 Tax=Lewinella sp. IMCC34183 TaxID=2248762 RepID=UPI000E235290|nr:hypothetical protein [Lewinella sp. IMCC34183]